MKFANTASVLWHLDAYGNIGDLQNALASISYEGGNTNTSGGINVMAQDVFNGANGDRYRVYFIIQITSNYSFFFGNFTKVT